MHLRVLTFNVWNEEGDPRRIQLINRELKRLNPDFVSFQEVVQRPAGGQLQQLISGMDFCATHQAVRQSYIAPFADRYGGSAVATRWPHHTVEVLDLRLAGVADVPWATIAVVVELPQLGELLFIGATASWRLETEAARELQAVAVAEVSGKLSLSFLP